LASASPLLVNTPSRIGTISRCVRGRTVFQAMPQDEAHKHTAFRSVPDGLLSVRLLRQSVGSLLLGHRLWANRDSEP
jgi:hypothetical protein